VVYVIGVNYDSSESISNWVTSIRDANPSAKIVLVDNFSSNEEREKCFSLSKDLDFKLLDSENIGYGRALNLAFKWVKDDCKGKPSTILAGNIDITFTTIPKEFETGNFCYIPSAYEGVRNRNPFMNRVQKSMLPLYNIAYFTNSSFFLKIAMLFNRIGGFVPSNTWAIHGSLFCFDVTLLKNTCEVFNESTFLYCEELEFASFVELEGFDYRNVELSYQHAAHVSTSKLVTDLSSFMHLWKPAFRNWNQRWS
jgi:GT2 family glycosyltransferase